MLSSVSSTFRLRPLIVKIALKKYLGGGMLDVVKLINWWRAELKAAMLLTGSKDISSLQSCQRTYTGELRGRLVELPASQEGVEHG